MKKILSLTLLMLSPLLLVAEEANATGPKKGTIDTYMVFPKDGQDSALKAALAAHAQKYHTGNWKWRVYEVLTGPNTGAYMILEGPNSWTDIEGRGDLGAEHQKDYETTILPLVKKSSPETYATYVASASTTDAGAFSTNKVLVSYSYLKPGRGPHALDDAKAWKKVYEKLGLSVVTWRTFFSGEPCLIFAGRLKEGFKDLDDESINFRKAADEVLGPGALDRLTESDTANYTREVDEIIDFKPELSSK
jgi:hypothetical protein